MNKRKTTLHALLMIATIGLISMPNGLTPNAAAVEFCTDGNGVPYVANQDTDGDGEPDCTDLDDDNDRISDAAEDEIGTNPLARDTDGDAIDDGVDLAPTTAGSTFPISVGVTKLIGRGSCGDGDAWDPYFGTLVLNVPGAAFPYNIAGWTRANHPWDYEGGGALPWARAEAPADASRWDFITHPWPWTETTAGMYDDDWSNADDRVALDGSRFVVAGHALSLISGIHGMTTTGAGACSATIGFGTTAGLGARDVRIPYLILAHNKELVTCEDLGLDCDEAAAQGTPWDPPVPAVPGTPNLPGYEPPSRGQIIGALPKPTVPPVTPPGIPSLPSVPGPPSLPVTPGMPGIPSLPSVPSIPAIPQPSPPPVPSIPKPTPPGLPAAPDPTEDVPSTKDLRDEAMVRVYAVLEKAPTPDLALSQTSAGTGAEAYDEMTIELGLVSLAAVAPVTDFSLQWTAADGQVLHLAFLAEDLGDGAIIAIGIVIDEDGSMTVGRTLTRLGSLA